MKKKYPIVGIIIGVIAAIAIVQYLPNSDGTDDVVIKRPLPYNQTTMVYDASSTINITNNIMYIQVKIEDSESNKIVIPLEKLLIKKTFYLDKDFKILYSTISPNPVHYDEYQKIGLFNTSKNIVFVYPTFTQAAYGPNGFYDYYRKTCDSTCLTIPIPKEEYGKYTSSVRGAAVLSILNYPHITDVDIDKHPDILKKFDRVIILHNEYVTQREFDAITSHPDVVYLYPNALYAKVQSDYAKNTITLIRGHGYPDASVANGFDWKFDNTQYEYNIQCNEWSFISIDNGKMLNCFPEYRMYYDQDLLTAIKN